MEQSTAEYPQVNSNTMARAMEVFVHGVAFTRSFTHPYLAERMAKTMGPLWVLRDAPRKRENYRVEEWVAHGVAPPEIDRIARRHTRGRFTICALCRCGEPDEGLRAAFKALGYRLNRTEPLMIHPLRCVPPVDASVVIARVRYCRSTWQTMRHCVNIGLRADRHALHLHAARGKSQRDPRSSVV